MKKQQQAFGGSEKMLKGGLHCHTKRSDGAGTPEEVIRLHYENGYDFLALTDHRYYNYATYAPDVPVTIIPGMEFDNTLDHDHGFRCFHTVCIGPEKENGNGFEQDERLDSGKAKDQFEYQAYLDDIHAKGNMTIYCHPEWSSTPASYFNKMKGNFAMELWNSGCAIEYEMDNKASYWDELLGQGVKIYGVATDDGHAMHHHCKGWVMVRAENNVSAILDALKNGAFYASCGPEIYDFYVEDGKVVIDCSPVAKVRIHSDMHPSFMRRDAEGNMTHAEFSIGEGEKCSYRYVRLTIIDKEGRQAWTNPIWLDEE